MPAFPKPVREINEARLEFCRQLACLVSEFGTTEAAIRHIDTCWYVRNGRSDAAHNRYGANSGMGTKPTDFLSFPLCRPMHEEFDHGRGYDAFVVKYGLEATSIPSHIVRINREFALTQKPQIKRERRLPAEPLMKYLRVLCVCGLMHDLSSGQIVRYGAGLRYQCPRLGTFERLRVCG